MCRGCLSWTNCVTAAGWQELMISVAAYWPDALKGNALVLTRRRRVPESVKQRGKEKHCFGFGRSTTADCLHARCRRLSVFIFSDKSKNAHAFIRVSEKARGEEGGSSWWCQAPSKQRASTWSSHSLAARTVHSWVHCLAVLQSSRPLEAKVRCSYVFISVQY